MTLAELIEAGQTLLHGNPEAANFQVCEYSERFGYTAITGLTCEEGEYGQPASRTTFEWKTGKFIKI